MSEMDEIQVKNPKRSLLYYVFADDELIKVHSIEGMEEQGKQNVLDSGVDFNIDDADSSYFQDRSDASEKRHRKTASSDSCNNDEDDDWSDEDDWYNDGEDKSDSDEPEPIRNRIRYEMAESGYDNGLDDSDYSCELDDLPDIICYEASETMDDA